MKQGTFSLYLQFQEILKPNYNSVDLAEVELVDKMPPEPRGNDSELLAVSLLRVYLFLYLCICCLSLSMFKISVQIFYTKGKIIFQIGSKWSIQFQV